MQYFKESECPNSEATSQHASYNEVLPHYCLGLSLFTSDNSDFIQYLESYNAFGLERSHDFMHSRLHFSMSDSRFSISNLLFYMFHSWIDVQVEMKLRSCNTPKQADSMNSKLTLLKRRTQLFDPILNPNKEDRSFGSYPLMEWADPVFSYQVAGIGSF